MPVTFRFQTCQQPGKLRLRTTNVDGTDEVNDLGMVGELAHQDTLNADFSNVQPGDSVCRTSIGTAQSPTPCLFQDVTRSREKLF